MIRTECDICRKKYRFENEFSGRIVRCREREAEFNVPVRTLWSSFEEASPDGAVSLRWAGIGAAVLVVMVILIVGAVELRIAMRERPTLPDTVIVGPLRSTPDTQSTTLPVPGETVIAAQAQATEVTPSSAAHPNGSTTFPPGGVGNSVSPAPPSVSAAPQSSAADELSELRGFSRTAQLQAVVLLPDGTAAAAIHGNRILQRLEVPQLKVSARYGTLASERLSSALQLLCEPGFVAAVENGAALSKDAQFLIPEACFVGRLIGDFPAMRVACHRMIILFSHLKGFEEDRDVVEKIISNMGELHFRLGQLFKKLGRHPYPFDHADKSMTLQEFVLPDLPDERDVGGMLYATQSAVERLCTVQMRLFARLATIAEQVEQRLGMEPLRQPPDEVPR